MRGRLTSEQGHVGPTLAAAVAIVAGIVASLGIGLDVKALAIVGVGLLSAALVLSTVPPHLWIRKVWRRIDRITDETDPDRDASGRIRIEF